MAKREEGFDPPVVREFNQETVNDAINKISDMVNLLLSEVRKLKEEIRANEE